MTSDIKHIVSSRGNTRRHTKTIRLNESLLSWNTSIVNDNFMKKFILVLSRQRQLLIKGFAVFFFLAESTFEEMC